MDQGFGPSSTRPPRDPAARPHNAETVASLADLVRRLGSPRVLVVGDVILDRYTWGDAERISPEAPVMVLRSDHCEDRPGGAASVAALVRGLGGRVSLAGLLGDDRDGGAMRRLLDESGIGHFAVVEDEGRPTTVKERLMGRAQHRHAHQILRIDREVRVPPSPPAAEELSRRLMGLVHEHDVVLVSDYAKGVCGPALLADLISRARARGIPVLVDPARDVDYGRYRGATCLTPNRREAQEATGMTIGRPEEALAVGREIRERFGLEAAVVTLDRDGMALVLGDGEAAVYAARPRQVYDITGAGDMVLAVLGIALAEGASFDQAVRLANVAGGLEVERVGVTPVTWDEVLAELEPRRLRGGDKILPPESLLPHVEARRRNGQRIVLVSGPFDLLHPGHLHWLEAAAAAGDCLVVGLHDDPTVRRLDGPGRPFFPQADRARMLAGLEVVDFVTIIGEDEPLELARVLRPDVLARGGPEPLAAASVRDVVESQGGSLVLVEALDASSPAEVLHRARDGRSSGGLSRP